MSIRWLPLLIVFFSLTSSLLADERPNIVFFFTDDQTTSTLGCYGNPSRSNAKHRFAREARHAIRKRVCQPFDLLG